jgi:hypothetical protein
MCKKRFVTGIILGMGLALAASSIEAREQRFQAHFAGTSTFRDDFSFTGGVVDYFTIAGNSTLGVTAHLGTHSTEQRGVEKSAVRGKGLKLCKWLPHMPPSSSPTRRGAVGVRW